MNKNDFYKEIMSKYTFNDEKIIKNSKRQTSGMMKVINSKWMPLTTAAAVFVAFYGAFVMFFSPKPPEIVQPRSTEASVSDDARREAMIIWEKLLIEDNRLAVEKTDMYISFEQPLTYKEFDAVLSLAASDTGGVHITALWNSEFIDIETARNSNSQTFYTGAKIIAAKGMFASLLSRPEFAAVELRYDENGNEMVNDDNFRPISTEPVTIHLPVPTPHTTATNGVVNVNPVATPSVTETVEGPPETGLPSENTTLPPATDVEYPDPVSTETPDAVITAPPEVADKTLEIPLDGLVHAEFINENKLIAFTPYRIVLYEILKDTNGKVSYEALSSYDALSARICFTDIKTNTLLIIAGDASGKQSELYLASGNDGEIIKLDVTGIMSKFDNISYAFFNNNTITLKALSESGNNALYIARKGEDYHFYKIDESEQRLIILNHTASDFIYAHVSDYNDVRFYSYNTATAVAYEIILPDIYGELKFERSPDVRNFAIITERGIYVWNADLNDLIERSIETEYVKFHKNSGLVLSDSSGNWYIINGADISSTTEYEANLIATKANVSSSYKITDTTPVLLTIEIIA